MQPLCYKPLNANISINPIYFILAARRQYVTIATDNNPNKQSTNVQRDDTFPTVKFPSPYEIYNINESTPLSNDVAKSLKRKYHRYVKLYHPDLCQNLNIIKNNDRTILTMDEKINRFKMASQAYEILIDPRKKHQYDITRANWNYGPSNSDIRFGDQSHNVYNNRNGYYSDRTYQYWNAGTWEESNRFYQGHGDKPVAMDHKSLVYWLIGFMICIAGSNLLTRLENTLIEKSEQAVTHEDIEKSLFNVYDNYGLDNDKLSRVRRFLWFRSWGLYRNGEEFDKEVKRNEDLITDMQNKPKKANDDKK